MQVFEQYSGTGVKKRVVMGYKEFESARRSIAGTEIVHMIRKKQMKTRYSSTFRAFSSLVA